MGRAFFIAPDIFFPALARGEPMFFVGAAAGAAVAGAFFIRPDFFFPRAAARLTGGFIFRAPMGCRGPVARGLFLAEIFFLGMAAC